MLKINKKTLVASVFTHTDRNKEWYKLQTKFVKKTTDNYDHAVFLDRISPEPFSDSIVIGSNKQDFIEICLDDNKWNLTPHLIGLEKITQFFFENNCYDKCLILDSDCFPIRYNWEKLLLDKMKNKPIAAAIRTENLDTFPHPCVFFMTKDAKGKFSFRPNKLYTNLMGDKFVDSGCNIPNHICYPLIRTNKYNPHPIIAGIYFDTFYHHCCGSRVVETRALTNYKYYDHMSLENEDKLFENLTKDPEYFIQKLRQLLP